VLSKYLNCDEGAIQEQLNHPQVYDKVNNFLQGRRLRTTYKNRNGEHNDFVFGRLSLKSNLEQHAYEGYLGVNLAQHFYCKFRQVT
jgi:hypothetical protein